PEQARDDVVLAEDHLADVRGDLLELLGDLRVYGLVHRGFSQRADRTKRRSFSHSFRASDVPAVSCAHIQKSTSSSATPHAVAYARMTRRSLSSGMPSTAAVSHMRRTTACRRSFGTRCATSAGMCTRNSSSA